ncbi:SulP family inorganic anion transporter [Leifsonia sp. TF02-11]|uniref:SulP family inorganic anion transporter n=1 Tax=Leifsonia sp. TF02-11 TaxID=2815212 RepID=UPI001AA1CD88|nr:SulP family inorganic anion transporter [Leifsonia sp. TF02-11]MBO1737998.1 STAS domain-containing protein [Leifsonia sp. TF02-11]
MSGTSTRESRSFRLLPGLTGHNVVRELLAGVTLLAIAIPLNIGYAQIAGLPPTAGLYALVVPAVLYALTVSSRQLVASPDAAAAALVASSIAGLAVSHGNYIALTLAQALIGGVLFLACAFLKLGFLANFLSKPILVGFVGGLALDILVSQVAKMLGVKIDSGGDFLGKVVGLVTGLPKANGWSVLIAAGALLVLLLGRRIAAAVPWALVVLVVGTIIVVLTDAPAAGVSVLGKVQAGPPTFTWPVIDWSQWLAVIPSAIALTLVTMGEGLLVSRSYGERRHYPTSPNRDLFAFGVGNLGAGITGGFFLGTSTSRTAAMDQAGSRTQLPTLVTAVGTLALLIFGTALLEDIPSPAIGAIVAVAVFPLLGIPDFIRLWRLDKFEFAIGAACFLGALLIGPIAGIVIAFVLAVVNVTRRAANPPIDTLAVDGDPAHSLLDEADPGTLTAPGVVVIRLAAPLFFANSTVFQQAVEHAVETTEASHVVLDMEAVTDIDVTGAESWQAVQDFLTARGADLSLSRVRPGIRDRLARLEIASGFTVFDTNRSAIAALRTDTTPRAG